MYARRAIANGVYVEHPFCRTPSEAAKIIAADEKHQADVANSRRNRYHPTLQAIDKSIAEASREVKLPLTERGNPLTQL